MWLKFVSFLITFDAVSCRLSKFEVQQIAKEVKEINDANLGWTASEDYEEIARVRKIMSQFSCEHSSANELPKFQYSPEELKDLPENFDAREKWPFCPSIGKIRNQGGCGSCWAIGSSEAMTDRICIHSKGKVNVSLSTMHLIECDQRSGGCRGGLPAHAYRFYHEQGIVTGGDKNSGEGCWPYKYGNNDVSLNGGDNGRNCSGQKCPNAKYPIPFEEDRHFCEEHRHVIGHPVQKRNLPSLFDFKHIPGEKQSSSHTAKLIGYGVENGTKYWLIANSWGPGWGDHGYIKIARGEKECHVESEAHTCIPKFK